MNQIRYYFWLFRCGLATCVMVLLFPLGFRRYMEGVNVIEGGREKRR